MAGDDDDDSFFPHWFFYGYPKRKEPAWKRDEKLTNKKEDDLFTDKPDPKPADTCEDLKEVIHVEKIELNITENTRAHRTDKYECTEDRTTDDGREEAAELVIRRGQPFRVTITFDRQFRKQKDDIIIILTTGKYGKMNSCTHGKMKVDESGKTKFTPDKWAAKLVSERSGPNGCDAVIDINPPATVAIGEWSLIVDTKTKLDKKTKIYRYEHPDDIYMLFNPWCKDDQTYMRDEKLLNEYVMNDHGCVYRGNKYAPKAKRWYFGQFEEGILDVSLFIIRKCFRGKEQYKLCDPVLVARAIAQVVNCCDSDNGVLWGNWSGDYSDGAQPGSWAGSVKILLQYLRTGEPVKYGQCWVFSGVTTTVCRAVGLPARSITNFASAHDTDLSCTIDKHYKFDDDGNLEEDKNSDSIWNFHVWNDVWMARPDIPCKNHEYDGWQAIDATPQEKSDGVYTCGPCPLYAIKHGQVNKPFDGAFIFSEVNADEIHWKPAPNGGYTKFKAKCDKVGKAMSTKRADGKPYDAGALFTSRYRQDVTCDYKYDEGSTENRRAVMRAALGTTNPKDAYRNIGDDQDVVFKLLHDADLKLGQDAEIKLTAKNTNKKYSRTVKAVTFNFQRQKYTGQIVKLVKSDKIEGEKELKPGQEFVFSTWMKHTDYVGNLEPENCMCIQAYAMVEKTRRRPMESCVKSHDVEFGEPELNVKMPETVKKGEDFDVEVTFNNPLSEQLTDCTVGYESGGFQHKSEITQDNVDSMGTYTGKFTLRAKRCGEFNVTFKFDSKQLKSITGAAGVKVKK